MSLTAWTDALVAELDLPAGTPVDLPLLLDAARDAAHAVERPAAPVTTFLIGLAAGLAIARQGDQPGAAATGGRPGSGAGIDGQALAIEVARCTSLCQDLAARWVPPGD